MYHKHVATQGGFRPAGQQLVSSDIPSNAYFVMNGLSPAGVAGTAFMGRYAAITLIQGFMIAGEGGSRPGRVAQLPRIAITRPAMVVVNACVGGHPEAPGVGSEAAPLPTTGGSASVGLSAVD